MLVLFLITFVIVLLAIFCGLGFGWLFNGKSRLQVGACGRAPTKKRDGESCGKESSCSLCEKKKK